MPVNKAKEYFAIKPKQYNCAQSVLKALEETHSEIDNFSKFGGGRAPEGFCGALYSALHMAPTDKHDSIKEEFLGEAGALNCREIRKKGQLTCAQCVEKATAINLKHRD